ncbi:MAG: hypothetical protein M0037_10440 [Betaproteobacteria bacterium]|nr:hypothetical protein [Betaproteobacteria bacterium]
MQIVVSRGEPLAEEARELPAATYNLAHSLLARGRGVAFVPIRSMQFLAILDPEEMVFVDHLRKDLAVIAWQRFRPQARGALDAPVPYHAAYYREDGAALMRRLQPELSKALAALAAKAHEGGAGRILTFARPAPGR